MAAEGDIFCDSEKYQRCFRSLVSFVYREEDSCKTNLNVLLDELNSIDYSQGVVSREDGNRLIVHLSKTVPFHQERLLTKACQIIINFSVRQQVVLYDYNVAAPVEFLVTAVQRCPSWTHADILHALTALLYHNGAKVKKYYDALLGKEGILSQFVSDNNIDEDILSGSVQCIENLTAKFPGEDYLTNEYCLICYDIFVTILHNVPNLKMDPNIQNKVLISSLRGLHNILLSTKVLVNTDIGILLAAIRAYIHHGLTSSQTIYIPESLCPTPMSQYDPNPAKPATIPEPKEEKTDATKEPGRNRGKRTRKKKQERAEDDKTADKSDKILMKGSTEYEALQLRPSWTKFHSSDSEYSDTEGGQTSRVRSACIKVRQCALNCLHTVVKNADKKIIFGYWSSFIPDVISGTNTTQSQTLFTTILKDPAPKCRMGALASLTAMIDGSKPYLAAAEDSPGTRSAFTSFSAVLGSMIKELHRCLLLALVAENFPLTLTQLIKCIGMLLSNAPYHRLQPGLLSRTVKQIRHFLQHRDPNVRVACLTCLGAIVSIQPPLLEICHIVQPSRPPVGTRIHHSGENTARNSVCEEEQTATGDSGFNSFNNCNQLQDGQQNKLSNQDTGQSSSGCVTPVLAASPGTQTPVFNDQTLQNYAHETSWVIKLCIKNVLSQKMDSSANRVNDFAPPWETSQPLIVFEPIPVRLESLQVLANITKGYFPIMRKSYILIQDLILSCLADSDPVVKLHGTKLLDELSQVMLQDFQNSATVGPEAITKAKLLEFWISFLNGPLPGLLQTDGINPVRANACDCISNVGMEVFQELPIGKRIMCITIVLGLINDDDKLVKSAAVRALGVYVLYPCLKQNVTFVADTANAVLMCMEDTSINVRMKAAWAMANLCDALVLNKESDATEFIEDFSDMLLLKLLMTATKSSQDSDKVKSNAVRAVGNALRYLPNRSLAKSNFTSAVKNSVQILVKNIVSGTMKVRWNACYAISNMFKNDGLPHGTVEWTKDIIKALGSVVHECKNFKVRINAALALSSLKERCSYGNIEQFKYVWHSLIVALKTSEDITDFAEFKYKDNLTEQIVGAILHLASILELDDITTLVPSLQQYGTLIQSYLYKLDKSPTIQTEKELAVKHLCEQSEQLTTPEQIEAFSSFKFVFLTAQDSLVDDASPQGKSAFKQIYD